MTLTKSIRLTAVSFLYTCAALFGSIAFAGPGGSDGGGGGGVLTADGHVRSLDMALAEGLSLKDFDAVTYAKIYLKSRGLFVSPIGRAENPETFFECSDKILSNQGNALLRYLQTSNFKIRVVTTDLPLDAISPTGARLYFPDELGWALSGTSLPINSLLSPSLAPALQRPIASYRRQKLGGIDTRETETVVISSPLLEALPKQDRCALEVHEMLRHLNSIDWYFTRILGTTEIEAITQKVIRGIPVSDDEIPATNLYRLLATYGVEKLKTMPASEVDAIEKKLEQERPSSKLDKDWFPTFAEFVILNEMKKNADLATLYGEIGILHIGRNSSHTVGAQMIREQRKQLAAPRYDLKKFFQTAAPRK